MSKRIKKRIKKGGAVTISVLKIYVIFVMGPSASGKSHGLETEFLTKIRERHPNIGNIYKFDGGIMRDQSCTYQHFKENTFMAESDRLGIYNNKFKQYAAAPFGLIGTDIKKEVKPKLLKIILDYHINNLNNMIDCTLKPLICTDVKKDIKSEIDNKYLYKIINTSCAVTGEGRGNNSEIGLVYVDTKKNKKDMDKIIADIKKKPRLYLIGKSQ